MFTANTKSLKQSVQAKSKDSTHYCTLYDSAGIAFWDEDASQLKQALHRLKQEGVTELKLYFEENTDIFQELVNKIKIIAINEETKHLYSIKNNRLLKNGLLQFFLSESLNHLIDAIITLYNGANKYEFISEKITITGKSVTTKVKITIPPQNEQKWERWLVTETDLTDIATREKEQIVSLQNTIKEKDKLISIIAHDLKNPFNNILGFSNLLSEKYDELGSKRIKTFLGYINDSATQSFNLLTNLLSWARSRSSESDFYPEIFELHNIIHENLALVGGSCRKKEITITSDIPKNVVLNTDINMIHFIVRNLLTNAIKFSYRNSTISISGKNTGMYYLISISDNGIGMSQKEKENIFSVNSNSETCTKKGTENEHGTGLGLILCKEFITIIGGTISVESIQGEGSCFSFTIPVK